MLTSFFFSPAQVDECNYIASRYKVFAKVTFVIFLQFAVLTTVLTVGRPSDVGLAWDAFSNYQNRVVFVVSIVGSFVSTVVTFFNPTNRWRICRGIAQHVHATIWAFRTRVEPYDIPVGGPADRPEERLRDAVIEAREQLLNSGDVRSTAFLRRIPSKVYTHGQYAPEAPRCGAGTQKVAPESPDDHIKPLDPDGYIRCGVVLAGGAIGAPFPTRGPPPRTQAARGDHARLLPA